MTNLTLKRYPNVITKRIFDALWMCRNVGIKNDDIDFLLAHHRKNLVKYIAEVGININKPPQELSTQNKQPIDIKYFSSIVELDEAFKAMHKFSEPNGADAYISKVVADRIISIKNSVIAIKPRKSKKNTDLLDDVVDYFIYRNLKSSDNKKEIYITAKSKFKLKLKDGSTKDLTEYQIRKAVKKYKSII